MLRLWKLDLSLSLDLMRQWLSARSDLSLHSISVDLKFLKEFLDLARVSLVFDVLACPSNDPVQHCGFLVVFVADAESSFHSKLVMFTELGLEPIRLLLCSGGREVIAVH